MLHTLPERTKKDRARFDCGSDGGFSGLTTTWATKLKIPLRLTVKMLHIVNAKVGADLMKALIQHVKQFKNLESLQIWDTLLVGEERR